MYLKGLELNGFKSFSSKVNLDFTRGITAIVGPNGSGKSNILDAILWVLGEQSYKSIRAKDSTDVIFLGGKNRKARSSATVNLIISNEDRFLDIESDEIVISRSINRNGDNEYSINGKKTRLKDIHTLLMDTGIGKQAYSVIGQGKVERIIASSPTEIRAVIDEAAGIKKAKTEKELSSKKLGLVESEIEKIALVEEELKRHLDRLEQDSKKARTYMAYTNKINVLKYMLFCYIKKDVENKLIELNINKDEVKQKYDLSIKLLEEVIRKIDDINITKKEIEKNIKELTFNSEEDINKVKELQQLEIEYITKKANFNADISIKEQERKSLETRKEALKNTINQYEKELLTKRKELENLVFNKEKLDNIISLNIETKEKLNAKIKECENNYKTYDVDKLRLKFENEDLEKRIEKSKLRLDQILKEKEDSLKKLEKIGVEFNKKEMLELKQQEFEKLKITYENLKKSKNAFQLNYDDTNTKYHSLKNIIENQKNMSASIQFVTQKAKEDKNVFGTLISMIDIPIKYQMALSVVAGYSFNDIVVKDNVTANKYIEMLKKNKIGASAFIPLDNIKIKNISNNNYENTLGYARNLVKNISGNESIKNAINYVFSNAVVVEKIEDGITLSKILNDKIVSLDGDIISSTGRIIGGYNTKKIDSTLLKINELKDLEIKKEKSFKELEKINKDITDIQSQFELSREELETLKNNYSNYLHEKLKIQRELDTYTFEIDENNEFITTKTNDIKSNEELITAISKKIVENESYLKKYINELNNMASSDEYEKELKEVEINIAILKEKEENLNIRYDEIKTEFNLLLNE